MSKQMEESKVGRPSVIVPDVISKLEEIFKIGGTIEEACASAGISPATYHREINRNEDFERKMTHARHYADIAAKNVVVTDITKKGNTDTAKWWLDKRQFNKQPMVAIQQNFNAKEYLPDVLNKKYEQD